MPTDTARINTEGQTPAAPPATNGGGTGVPAGDVALPGAVEKLKRSSADVLRASAPSPSAS